VEAAVKLLDGQAVLVTGSSQGFTRTLAAELGPRGVRVNALAPGLLETTDASSATTPEVFELIRQSTPLRRVTTPEDAAKAAVPFVSKLFGAVTGQYVAVDGGLTMP
jgi:3-oxoacyl-[acyl-carrier protein] reductase